MTQSLSDFRRSVLYKEHKSSKDSITFSNYDIHREIRRLHPEFYIHRDIYSKIIRQINEFLVEELLDKGYVRFPRYFGEIRIFVRKSKIVLGKDKKVRHSLQPDWDKSIRYWHDNPDKPRKVIFRPPSDVYQIRWMDLRKDCFESIRNYLFKTSRPLKVKLKNKILNTPDITAYEH